MSNIQDEKTDLTRRAVLKSAGVAMIAGLTTSAAFGTTASAHTMPTIGTQERNAGPLGGRLQGVQHFGLTVQNMDRAYAFYTDVLGGTEVMRDGDFQRADSLLYFSRNRSSRACQSANHGSARPERRLSAA